jgi:hypothetical protein
MDTDAKRQMLDEAIADMLARTLTLGRRAGVGLIDPATPNDLLDEVISVGRANGKINAVGMHVRLSFNQSPERYIWLFTRPCLCIVATLAGQAAPTAEAATAYMISFGLEHEAAWYRGCTVTLVLKDAVEKDRALWPVGCAHGPAAVPAC